APRGRDRASAPEDPAVELRDSREEAAFRASVRSWLEANLPAGDRREWSRKMYDAGYAGLTWPEEYGGRGAPYPHQAFALEERAPAEAPPHMGGIRLGMAAATDHLSDDRVPDSPLPADTPLGQAFRGHR